MKRSATPASAAIELPRARTIGDKSIEECLAARRSCRAFLNEKLSLQAISQVLWAAQGVTGLGGLRTAPSPGAIYPVHTYLIALNVAGLRAGAYAYDPDRHVIARWKSGDLRNPLQKAACDQPEVETASAAVLLAVSYGRMKREFGERGPRLALIEAGHIAQNICLQAVALSLGALTYGRTDDAELKRVVDLPEPEEPVYLVLFGPK